MRVRKWGKSLAVVLPGEIVRKLGLKAGDDINVRADGDGVAVVRRRSPEEVLAELEQFRGLLADGDRLSREEIHER